LLQTKNSNKKFLTNVDISIGFNYLKVDKLIANRDMKIVKKSGEGYSETSYRRKKVLLICSSEIELFLIRRFLPQDRWIIHESDSIIKGLKFLNYLSFDLIIIDDCILGRDANSTIKKLDNIQVVSRIPKLLLVSENYKSYIEDLSSMRGFDYIKKPLLEEIFLHRVNQLLSNDESLHIGGGYFLNESKNLLDRALELSSIYQNIFDLDEQPAAIYNRKSKKLVEINGKFEELFGSVEFVNRAIKNSRFIKRFVPYESELINFLNYYDPLDWGEKIVGELSFNYSIKIKKRFEEFSFIIIAKKLEVSEGEYYLFKLVNIYDFMPKSEIKSSKIDLKESNLASFKDEFIKLRELLKSERVLKNKNIESVVYQLNTKLSILCDDNSIIESYKSDDRSDLLKEISEFLSQEFAGREIRLNGTALNKPADMELIATSTDVGRLKSIIRDLINKFEDESQIELYIYKKSEHIFIEIASDDIKNGELDKELQEKISKLKAKIKVVKDDEAGKLIYLLIITE
jgi:hypothetical protein